MISSGQLTGFALTALVLVAVPGPSVLFVIGRALSLGRGPAVAGVVGNALGVFVVAVLIAFGLGSLVATSEAVLLVVKLVGGAYLVWLGAQAVRARHALALSFVRTGRTVSRRQAARQGFVVGVANPKALIIFGAVLPQFVDRSAGHVTTQMLQLSLVALSIALVSDTIWALAASAVRGWLARRPGRLAAIGGAGGVAMIAVGVDVALSGRRD